jgi:8-oxo-dGTP diphosphatase
MSKVRAPRLVVAVLIKKGSKFLLIKEELEDKKETWIIPGGGVDFGESLEQAAIREIKEELGLDIKITKFIKFHESVFPDFNYHSVIFFFLAKSLSDKIKIGEEKILDAQYFSVKQMHKLDLVDSAQWLLKGV